MPPHRNAICNQGRINEKSTPFPELRQEGKKGRQRGKEQGTELPNASGCGTCALGSKVQITLGDNKEGNERGNDIGIDSAPPIHPDRRRAAPGREFDYGTCGDWRARVKGGF